MPNDDTQTNQAPPSYAEATGDRPSGRDSQARRPWTDEKLAMQESRSQLQEFAPPYSGPSNPPEPQALKFVVTLRKSILAPTTMDIVPSQPHADLSHWNLQYTTKLTAKMNRQAAAPQQSFPLRQIAEMIFPEHLEPGCGVIIKFEPHEEEAARIGVRQRHAAFRHDKFMAITGWFTTYYGIDLPALGRNNAGLRATWKVAKGEEKSDKAQDSSPSQRSEKMPKPSEKDATMASEVLPGPISKKERWTPFPLQHLMMEQGDGAPELLATYARSAPWARETGILTMPSSSQPRTAELIEAIVIICAAMVEVQDRMTLTASLLEAGMDNISIKVKGKAKARSGDCRR